MLENTGSLFGENYSRGPAYLKILNRQFDGEFYVLDEFQSGSSLSDLDI